jgi:hypothetical protein
MLRARRPSDCDLIRSRAKEYSLRLHVQNDSGAHPASSSMDKGSFITVVKRPGLEADHTPSTVEVVPPFPHTSLKTSHITLVK